MRARARLCCRRTDRSHRRSPRCAAVSTPGTRARSDWSRARGKGGAKNGRTVGSRGSTSPKSLKRVATVSNTVTRWRSRCATRVPRTRVGATDRAPARRTIVRTRFRATCCTARTRARSGTRAASGRARAGPRRLRSRARRRPARLVRRTPLPGRAGSTGTRGRTARRRRDTTTVGARTRVRSPVPSSNTSPAVSTREQLRRSAQPITRTDTCARIESQHRVRELADGAQPNLVARVHSVPRREARRIAAVRIRQRGVDDLHQLAYSFRAKRSPGGTRTGVGPNRDRSTARCRSRARPTPCTATPRHARKPARAGRGSARRHRSSTRVTAADRARSRARAKAYEHPGPRVAVALPSAHGFTLRSGRPRVGEMAVLSAPAEGHRRHRAGRRREWRSRRHVGSASREREHRVLFASTRRSSLVSTGTSRSSPPTRSASSHPTVSASSTPPTTGPGRRAGRRPAPAASSSPRSRRTAWKAPCRTRRAAPPSAADADGPRCEP